MLHTDWSYAGPLTRRCTRAPARPRSTGAAAARDPRRGYTVVGVFATPAAAQAAAAELLPRLRAARPHWAAAYFPTLTLFNEYLFADGAHSPTGAAPLAALVAQLGGRALVEGCRRPAQTAVAAEHSRVLIRVSYRAPETGEAQHSLLDGGQFFRLAEGLPAMLAALGAAGCTELRCVFSEVSAGAAE